MIENMKILQNQENFSTIEYREITTSLVKAVESLFVPNWLKNMHRNDFIAGILMYLCAGKFDAVVTVSHRPAMVYGIFCRIFGKRCPVHIAKEFFIEIGNYSKPTLKNRVLSSFYRFSLKNVQAVIVNATGEIPSYSCVLDLPASRFQFIPWPSNINEPRMIANHNGYVLAVGRSLRDWKTFFNAIDGLTLKCIVIATKVDIIGLTIPSNVELLCDIQRDKYLELLKYSKIVCIPLVETNRSTGQASFLEAMAFGKPVIVADVVGAVDYIEPFENGVLYSSGNSDDLRAKIVRLNENEELRKKISENGLRKITEKFNKTIYAKSMINILSILCNNSVFKSQVVK